MELAESKPEGIDQISCFEMTIICGDHSIAELLKCSGVWRSFLREEIEGIVPACADEEDGLGQQGRCSVGAQSG